MAGRLPVRDFNFLGAGGSIIIDMSMFESMTMHGVLSLADVFSYSPEGKKSISQ